MTVFFLNRMRPLFSMKKYKHLYSSQKKKLTKKELKIMKNTPFLIIRM